MYVNIKKMRRQFGMSQEDYARKVGVGQTTVSFMEKGLRDLSPETYEKLCQAFGTETVEMYVEPNPMTARPVSPDLSSLGELIPILKEQQRQTNELIELLRQSLNFIKEMAQR